MEKMFKLQRISHHFRVGIAVLVCLTVTALMTIDASASVDFVNQWPATPTIVSTGTAGTISGKYTPGTGVNRLMLVAVATKYSAGPATAPLFTVTYGGQPVTLIAATTAASAQNGLWLGYMNNTGINNGVSGGKILQVINNTTTNLTAMSATVAVFNGVDQTTPYTGSGQNALAATATSVATSFTPGANCKAGNNGLSVYVTNWAGANNASSVTGYSEIRDILSSGGTINLAAGYKAITSTTAETLSSTATLNYGAIAGVSINPVINSGTNYSTVTSCGDCHSYPPQDGTARNVPSGIFPGSHEKHSGEADQQYAMACTNCHYNAVGLNHQTGFKNITGSKLPGNAYLGGKRIPMSNTSTLNTCSNTSCHSSGRGTGMGTRQYATTVAWGTNGTTNCLACHAGRASAQGAPANSSAGFKLSTTHMQHMKAPYTAANINCNICHAKTVTDAATLKSYTGMTYHANGTPNVNFTNIAYASYTSYKANKTCTNVSCHGGKSKGAWNATSINNDNTCLHCHGYGTGSGTALRADKYNSAPGWGGNGISTDGNVASTDPRVGSHFKHLSSASVKKMKCNECHLVPSNPYDAGHSDTKRFSSATITFSQASTANKNTTSPVYTSGSALVPATCNTTYCHGSKMPDGDTSGANRSPQWNQTLNCGSCHGNPPIFGSSSSAHVGSVATTSCVGCHKTVTDATGKIINKSLHLDGFVSVLVDTTVISSCNKCHGNPPQTLTYGRYSGLVKTPKTLAMGASPANAGAHKKHAANGLTCNTCHNNYNAGVHPDNKIQIFFRISSNTISGWNTTAQRAAYGTYSGNIPTGGTPVDTVSSTLVRGTANNTNNSCNTYCHGGWANSNKNMNPRWTSGTAATNCGACHGATAAAPPQIGTHARHAGYSSALTARQGYSYSCNKCHPNRLSSNHVKGAVHVRFSTAVLGTNATYTKTGATLTTPTGSRLYTTRGLAGDIADGTCSNITCHSTGRATGMGVLRTYSTVAWGNTTRNCLSCHGGRTSATGTPARSIKNFTLTTSHYQHLKYPSANINCQTCHAQTTKDAATLKDFSGVKRHVNNKRDVNFTASLPYGTYTSYKSLESGSSSNTKTCNNLSCHGGKSRSAWSATTTNNDNSCLHCHGLGTGLGTALRADKYNAAPGWNGGISTDGITVATNIRVGAHFKHLSSIYVKKMKCNECHAVPSTPFEGTHMATARYNSQTLTFSQASTANKNTTTPAFTAGTSVVPANCTTYCHGTNLKNGDTTVGTVRTPTWNQDLTTGGNCGKCHGNPPNSVSVSHLTATPTFGCGGCHSMVVNGAGTIINKNLHMNGIVEFVSSCNACHSYFGADAWTSSYGTEGASFNAHSKHINYLVAKAGVTPNKDSDAYGGATFQVTCGVCHTWDSAQHTTGGGGSRLINFGNNSTARQFGGSHPKYNGVSGASSSVNPKSCSNIDCHYRTSPVWSTY